MKPSRYVWILIAIALVVVPSCFHSLTTQPIAVGPDVTPKVPEDDKKQVPQEPKTTVRPSLPMDKIKDFSERTNAFGLDLYRKLVKPDKNLFVSPYSAATVLTMTLAGARDETASQMGKVLHYKDSSDDIHPTVAQMIKVIKASDNKDGITLQTANALWGQKGHAFRKEFLDLTETYYGGAFRQVDFKNAPVQAEQEINKWASDNTAGRITKIIKKLSPATRLILANAVYFKGKWEHQFKKKKTVKDHFILRDGQKVPVMMMYQSEKHLYTETDDLQILEMNYMGRDVSMVILLPKKGKKLLEVEKSISTKSIGSHIRKLTTREVRVYLPRFEVTDSMNLSDFLKSLGMRDAFSPRDADFSGIAPRKEQLYIDKVLQKSYIKTDEIGSEAAAVTSVEMRKGMQSPREPEPIPVFRADHPFMFFIRHKPTNCILFMGRFANPAQVSKK